MGYLDVHHDDLGWLVGHFWSTRLAELRKNMKRPVRMSFNSFSSLLSNSMLTLHYHAYETFCFVICNTM